MRFVRVNHVFADMTGLPLSRHLGRGPSELLPPEVATQFNQALETVLPTGEPVLNDIEFHGEKNGTLPDLARQRLPGALRTSPGPLGRRHYSSMSASRTALKKPCARPRNSPPPAASPLPSRTRSTTLWKGSRTCSILLRTFCDLTPPALDYVITAEQQTRRIADIAQKTLRFYRQSTLPVRAGVGELTDSILDLYRSRMHTLNIRMERDIDPDLTLFCYEGEIRQVLANLIGNAIDATSAGGRLIVRARQSRHWGRGEAPGVRIAIADTGTGMTATVRKRIFEAFFTTKEATGTGLGLWVSLEIIQKHRGLVHVRSRPAGSVPESGTVFQLFLPDDESLGSRPRPAETEANVAAD